MAHTGRRLEALQTATDASQTGEAQIAERGYNAAIHFIIAGVTLAASDQLKRATVTHSNDYPLENRIALYDATIESLARIDTVAARAAIDTCIADNARIEDRQPESREPPVLDEKRFPSIIPLFSEELTPKGH